MRGFTLIEALVAMGLICLILLVLLNVFGTGNRAVHLCQSRAQVLQLGRRVLAQGQAQGYTNLVPANSTVQLSWTENGVQAAQTVTYALQSSDLAPGRKSVWVDLAWTDQGVSRQMTLESRLVQLP